MPRGVPNSPTKPSTDPLLAALIEKLPQGGTDWPAADREAWLTMMRMAFNVVYGAAGDVVSGGTVGGVTTSVVVPATFLPGSGAALGAMVNPAIAGMTSVAPPHSPKSPAYYIDSDGYAMRNGIPIDPHEIPPGATLWDERTTHEVMDVTTILWKTGGATKQPPPPEVHFRAGKARAHVTSDGVMT